MPIAALLLAAAAPAAVTVPASCAGKDGWSEPTVPQNIADNVWYVGTCGITVVLIASPLGHVVIDGGPRDAGPLVAKSIEAAGFRLQDVRWIVSSHEHHDHAGGIAELQRLTGAQIAATAPNAAVLRTGIPAPGDPQAGILEPFAPVRVDRVLADGETLRWGPIALTAHATPGHSPGSTSWTWTSCAGATCHHYAYADSVSAVSAPGYRFSDHPAYVANFHRALDTIAAFDCDVIITPHPSASGLFAKLAGTVPLSAPRTCEAYAAQGAAALATRMVKEAAGQ
ncbi:MAG: subclass B3 metallo-beta-lactamase [Sphingomonadales bacterium]|nr:subclass B3 metallo-beta-lactamase [Sphingomonadales bacterium]